MFFQLTLLACLLVGSLSANTGAHHPHFAAHHPHQPFAAAPAGPVADSAEQPSVPTRQLPTTNFKCADMPYSVGLFADTQLNCEVYHYCTPGYQHTFFCGEGTAFNQKTLTCDYPQNFTCADSKIYFVQNAGIGVETGLAAPVVPKSSFTCQGKPFVPGYYADIEANCQVYHMCVDDQQFSFNCAEGTVFSQELLTCTYAAEVNCQQSSQFYYKNDDIGVSQEEFRHRPPICRRHPHLHFCRHHTDPQ